jgi:hypothetical protein
VEALFLQGLSPKHSINASTIASHRFRKLTRDQIAAGLCIPLKEANAVDVTQDYIAQRDRPQNKVLFARDVQADLMGMKARKKNRSTVHLTTTRSRILQSKPSMRRRGPIKSKVSTTNASTKL